MQSSFVPALFQGMHESRKVKLPPFAFSVGARAIQEQLVSLA